MPGIGVGQQHGVGAVSYTHLDVYKRQTQESFSSLTNRSDQGDDSCHEEKYLEGGNRGGIYHLPVYSNLLMGEFERSGMGLKRGVV